MSRSRGAVASWSTANIVIAPLFEAARFIGVLISVENATEHSRLKEQMMRIAEQHATAIEELQSANEELESTNEELQSANEELETANEELQSTNEELETVKEELQSANEELRPSTRSSECRTAELNQLDAFHRSLINGLELGLAVLNCDGVVVTWNQVAEGMWGLRAEQALHRPFTALPIGEVVPRAHAVLQRVLSTGEAGEVVDVPYAMPGGSARPGTLRMVPLRDGTGEVTGVLAVMRAGDGRGSERSDHAGQILRGDGLDQVGIEAGLASSPPRLVVAVAAEGDQPDAVSQPAANPPSGLEAVHVGQAEIEDHDVR